MFSKNANPENWHRPLKGTFKLEGRKKCTTMSIQALQFCQQYSETNARKKGGQLAECVRCCINCHKDECRTMCEQAIRRGRRVDALRRVVVTRDVDDSGMVSSS